MKLPNDTPASIRKAAHAQKMMGKHFRRMERGVTELENVVAELDSPLKRAAVLENVSKRVILERAAAARKAEKE